MAGKRKQTFNLDEALCMINDWIDEEDGPGDDEADDDAIDDLPNLNGDVEDEDADIDEEEEEEEDEDTEDIEVPQRHRRLLTYEKAGGEFY